MGILDYFRGTPEQQKKAEAQRAQDTASGATAFTDLDEAYKSGDEERIRQARIAAARAYRPGIATNRQEQQERATEFDKDLGVAAAAPARLLTTLPELGSIAVQAGQAAGIFPGGDTSVQNEPFMTRLAANRYTNGGFDAVKQNIAEFQQKYKEANPNATAEELSNATESYTKSNGFADFEKRYLPTARRYIEGAGEAIDNTFGAPTDRQKNLRQTLINVGAQALVPTGLASKAIEQAAGKGAATAFDIAVPGTTNFTKTGVAVNAGLGAGITVGADVALNNSKGIKELVGEHPKTAASLVAGNALLASTTEAQAQDVDDTNSETHVKSSVANLADGAIIATTLLGGAALLARKINVSKALENAQQSTGPVNLGPNKFKNMEGDALTRAETTVNELAPVKKAYLDAGYEYKDATTKLNEHTKHFRGNAYQTVDHWTTSGHLEGLEKPTISGQAFAKVRQDLFDNGKLEDFEKYITLKDALDDRRLKIKRAQDEFIKLSNDIENAAKKGDDASIAGLEQARRTAYDNWMAAKNDTPESRPNAQGFSTSEIEELVKRGALDEDFARVEQIFKQSVKDLQEYKVRNGLVSADDAAKAMSERPNYIPLRQDPLSMDGNTRTGFARLAEKVKAKLGKTVEDPIGNAAENAAEASMIGGIAGKTRDLDNAFAVNVRMNPFDAIITEWENTIKINERNKFKTLVVDDLSRSGVAQQYSHANGQTQFSQKQVQMLAAKNMLPDTNTHTAILRDGKIEFYKFDDVSVKHAIEYAPLVSIPVFREFNRVWKMGTTGTANPQFGLTNTFYDSSIINQMRNRDSVYGSDILFKAINQNNPTLQKLGDVTRMAGTLYVDPGQHIANVVGAINFMFRENQAAIVNKITNDLTSSSGFFNTLANTIGRDKVQTVGAAMAKNLEESLFYQAVKGNAVHSVAYQTAFDTVKEVDRIIDTMKIPKALRDIGNIATSPIQAALFEYRAMMASLSNASRFAYMQQNMLMAAMKHGSYDAIPQKTIDKIINEGRTLAGNFTIKPGSKTLQGIDSISPFVNVQFQSTRNVYERMKGDPYIATMALSGALLPAIFSTHWMSTSNKENYEDYWRNTPQWERHTTLFLPTPQNVLHWAQTGEWKSMREGGVIKIPLAPDWRGITNMVITGLRATGIMPYGTKDQLAPMDTATETAAAFKHLMPLNTPPLVNFAAAPSGVKVDIGNIIPGAKDPIFKPPSRGYDLQTMNAASTISKPMAETIGALFGVAGRNYLEALNTYTVRSIKGESVMDAFSGAAKELSDRKTFLRFDAPMLANAAKRVYTFNPVSERAMEMRKPFDTMAYDNNFRKVRLNDPMLQQIATVIQTAGKSNPELKANRALYKQLKDQFDAIETNRTIPYADRIARQSEINREINKLNANNLRTMLDIEKGLDNQYGIEFRRRFNEPFSIKAAFERINKERVTTNIQRRVVSQ